MSPRPFAVLVATAAALSGCAGGGAPQDVSVAAVADATRAADSARVRFDVTYSGGDPSTVSEGVVDFRSGDTRLETSSGASDDSIALTITANGISFFGPKDQKGEGPSWIRLPTPETGETQAPAGPSLSPDLLVDELKGSATDVREAGSAKIRGHSTTTYRLDLRSGSRVLPLMMIPPKEAVVATMDVDDQGRLRRLVVKPDKPRGATGGDDVDGSLPVPSRSALELWDFGVNVDVVAPDSSRVIDFDDPRAGELLSRLVDGAGLSPDSAALPDLEEPKLSGPFLKVAGGSWEEVAWAVWEAPTSDGRLCHTVELAPPPASDSFAGGPIPGVIEHDGHSASCGPPADLFRRGDPVQTFGTQYAKAGYWYMAGTVAPEISALEVDLVDGRTLRVQVDGQSHVFTLFNRGVLDVMEIRPDAGGKASITCAVEEDELRPGLLNCSGTVHR